MSYHTTQDLLVLGLITGVLSVFGLPWQCAATVQSLNHVRAMSNSDMEEQPDGSKEEVTAASFQLQMWCSRVCVRVRVCCTWSVCCMAWSSRVPRMLAAVGARRPLQASSLIAAVRYALGVRS
jgi:HCO3- transporter family